jgi:hypothetical protein
MYLQIGLIKCVMNVFLMQIKYIPCDSEVITSEILVLFPNSTTAITFCNEEKKSEVLCLKEMLTPTVPPDKNT